MYALFQRAARNMVEMQEISYNDMFLIVFIPTLLG